MKRVCVCVLSHLSLMYMLPCSVEGADCFSYLKLGLNHTPAGLKAHEAIIGYHGLFHTHYQKQHATTLSGLSQ